MGQGDQGSGRRGELSLTPRAPAAGSGRRRRRTPRTPWPSRPRRRCRATSHAPASSAAAIRVNAADRRLGVCGFDLAQEDCLARDAGRRDVGLSLAVPGAAQAAPRVACSTVTGSVAALPAAVQIDPRRCVDADAVDPQTYRRQIARPPPHVLFAPHFLEAGNGRCRDRGASLPTSAASTSSKSPLDIPLR